MPAWHDPGRDWEYVETDIEAEPLSVYCAACDGPTTIIDKHYGTRYTGRWDRDDSDAAYYTLEW
jgi:hypothetical protein